MNPIVEKVYQIGIIPVIAFMLLHQKHLPLTFYEFPCCSILSRSAWERRRYSGLCSSADSNLPAL